ncbi:excalibur calcium-binding domain-containing protein [Streptomyces kanasensis]|uniref:excalibur calcium-binding domain-containing protein n=1 Tax=Streptomyces kanasensis TaxID=936756 RepID=UPI00380CC41F
MPPTRRRAAVVVRPSSRRDRDGDGIGCEAIFGVGGHQQCGERDGGGCLVHDPHLTPGRVCAAASRRSKVLSGAQRANRP